MQCTVVMPTLGLALPITDELLSEIEHKSKLTTRVIIINNGREQLAARYAKHKKIDVVDDMPNLMVNPAWNYGLSKVETDLFLLLNDDILLNGILLDEAVRLLERRDDINLTTVKTVVDHDFRRMKEGLSRQKHADDLDFEILTYPDGIKQGWFMMARTSSWSPIKSECLIMKGDDDLYVHNQLSFAGACLIKNRTIYHSESSTVRRVHMQKLPDLAKPLDLQSIADWI